MTVIGRTGPFPRQLLVPASSHLVGRARAAAAGQAGGQTDLAIDVPAFHGLEPRLRLQYDANGRDGWLGVGWSLSGLSLISRVGPDHSLPGPNDRHFLLDGMDLLPCNHVASSSPGCQHASSPAVPLADRYATKVEGYVIDPQTAPLDPASNRVDLRVATIGEGARETPRGSADFGADNGTAVEVWV